jgi:hypothetical protein
MDHDSSPCTEFAAHALLTTALLPPRSHVQVAVKYQTTSLIYRAGSFCRLPRLLHNRRKHLLMPKTASYGVI